MRCENCVFRARATKRRAQVPGGLQPRGMGLDWSSEAERTQVVEVKYPLAELEANGLECR